MGDSIPLFVSRGSWSQYQWYRNFIPITGANDSVYQVKTTGIYQLTVTSPAGCKATVSTTLTVNPVPQASFTVNQPIQCVNANSFAFNNTSTIASGTIKSYWDFDNGDTSMQTSPVKTFNAARFHVVRLITAGDGGCRDTATDIIIVSPKPEPAFTANDVELCEKGNLFFFHDNSTMAGGTLTRKWIFGDGGYDSVPHPVHSFSAAGTYDVRLVSVSNRGCRDSVTKPITVYPQPGATVNPSGLTSFCEGDSVPLNVLISPGTSVRWLSNGVAFAHDTFPLRFAASGGIFRALTISEHGCRDTSEEILAIVDPLPVASILANNDSVFCNGRHTYLEAAYSNSYTYQWKRFGLELAGETDSVLLVTSAGDYTVLVRSDKGCPAESSPRSINVLTLPPASAVVFGKSSICPGDSALLYANTGTGLRYRWMRGNIWFPDDTTVVISTYTAGLFRVLVTDLNGCTDTSAVVEVKASAAASIDSIVGPQVTTLGMPATFHVITPDAKRFFWSSLHAGIAGQGNDSVDVTWNETGTFALVLTLTTSEECHASDSIQVRVDSQPQPAPFANLTIAPNPVTDKLVIISPFDLYDGRIEITSMNGKVVMQELVQYHGTTCEIRLPAVSNGMYIATITAGGHSARLKFFKQ
jgi:PKD repeat protein